MNAYLKQLVKSLFLLNKLEFKGTPRPKLLGCVFSVVYDKVKDSIYPQNLFLESCRTLRFLMNLEVVSEDRDHHSEASVKFS